MVEPREPIDWASLPPSEKERLSLKLSLFSLRSKNRDFRTDTDPKLIRAYFDALCRHASPLRFPPKVRTVFSALAASANPPILLPEETLPGQETPRPEWDEGTEPEAEPEPPAPAEIELVAETPSLSTPPSGPTEEKSPQSPAEASRAAGGKNAARETTVAAGKPLTAAEAPKWQNAPVPTEGGVEAPPAKAATYDGSAATYDDALREYARLTEELERIEMGVNLVARKDHALRRQNELLLRKVDRLRDRAEAAEQEARQLERETRRPPPPREEVTWESPRPARRQEVPDPEPEPFAPRWPVIVAVGIALVLAIALVLSYVHR